MSANINIYELLAILFIHWVADFVLQTDWQAKNKSKLAEALINHTGVYSFSFLVPMLFLFSSPSTLSALSFVFITWVFHTVTDYFTSRLNARLWKAQRVHAFFVSVGFDQLLHFAQLIFTYQLLK